MNLSEIFSFENLYSAYKHCRNSKQHKGEVIRFESNLSVNISNLSKELINKTYKLGKYKKFYIYEPKERLIEALPFKDRVMVRCFCDIVLRDKIEVKLIYDNCACRKNKGTTFAINRLHIFLRNEYMKSKDNNIYFLKCDICKYFPSINHDILISMLEKIDFSDDEMWIMNTGNDSIVNLLMLSKCYGREKDAAGLFDFLVQTYDGNYKRFRQEPLFTDGGPIDYCCYNDHRTTICIILEKHISKRSTIIFYYRRGKHRN